VSVKRNEKGQFEKGTDSPNPGGRPKGSITKLMREFMYEIDDTGFSRIQHLCFILWDAALKGDLQAIKLIMDRIDGTPRQSIEMSKKHDVIKIMEFEGDTRYNDDDVIA
jgi:hypothetical protein|tara:strand:+ start:290 stop:616 length:327 start_codon:yes stop_codon:yes gene_type:complete